MGKASKRRAPGGASTAPRETGGPAAKPAAAPAPATPVSAVLRSPTLALAWLSLLITLFSVGATIWFRDNLDMGAIREPTGSIIWAALTATLFARRWRERQGAAERKPGS